MLVEVIVKYKPALEGHGSAESRISKQVRVDAIYLEQIKSNGVKHLQANGVCGFWKFWGFFDIVDFLFSGFFLVGPG